MSAVAAEAISEASTLKEDLALAAERLRIVESRAVAEAPAHKEALTLAAERLRIAEARAIEEANSEASGSAEDGGSGTLSSEDDILDVVGQCMDQERALLSRLRELEGARIAEIRKEFELRRLRYLAGRPRGPEDVELVRQARMRGTEKSTGPCKGKGKGKAKDGTKARRR